MEGWFDVWVIRESPEEGEKKKKHVLLHMQRSMCQIIVIDTEH